MRCHNVHGKYQSFQNWTPGGETVCYSCFVFNRPFVIEEKNDISQSNTANSQQKEDKY